MKRVGVFLHKYFVPLILLWVLVCSLFLAWNMSMTTDEGIHTASAYLALTRGEHRFDPEHPFLYKYLTAIPLVIMRPNPPVDDQRLWDTASPIMYDSWAEARSWTDHWFYTSDNNAQLMIFLARLAGVATLLGLCFTVYKLGTLWFSERVGRWALFFAAFNPTLLAHGSMTNDDVAMAFAGLLALWALWLYKEKPSIKQAIWVGVGLGAAVTTKFSAIYFMPVALFWMIYLVVTKRVAWKVALRDTLFALVTIWAFIWIVYFGSSPMDLSTPENQPQAGFIVSQIQKVMNTLHLNYYTTIRIVHDILPSNFTKGMLLTVGSSYYGRATYLLDKHLASGVWYYFPVLFLLKTQLVALMLGIVGIWMSFKTSVKKWQPITFLLGFTALVIAAISIKSKLNLGIRHISPLLVIFAFVCGVVIVYLQKKITWKYLGVLVAILYVLPVIMQLHNLIGFSNIFIPDKSQTFKYFDDSNLDWGQQVHAIVAYVKNDLNDAHVYSNFSWNPYALAYFDVHATNFNPEGYLDGTYIVTATELDQSEFLRFRSEKPTKVIDTATFAYTFRDNKNLAE